jgi:uncharacterized protein YukE
LTTPPSNYDDPSLLIRVDPDNMFSHVGDMTSEAQVIGDAITAIVGIWNNLKLGWVGTSASEAQDFSTNWVNAVTALFGNGAAGGAFQKIADAVGMASTNYGEAESSNEQMFLTLIKSLGSSSSSTAVPPPTRDQQQGPVTETAPAP